MLVNGNSVEDLVLLYNRHIDMLGGGLYRRVTEGYLKKFSGSEAEMVIMHDIAELHCKITGDDVSNLGLKELYKVVYGLPELGLAVEDEVLEFIVQWLRFYANVLGEDS